LALLALGVKPGDEILVPTLTYIATANAVAYCGATPVLVDSEAVSFGMDPALIEERISPRTKGILVVHLYGHPADMDPILDLARRRNLFVVEDAAEAHGALYKGRKVGSLSEAATFSFYGNKVITTGEGGMITTSDPQLRDRLQLYRGQGMDPQRRYWFPVVGYNYRMTNIAAAIGLAQLEQLEVQLAKRRQIAGWYYDALKGLEGSLHLPAEATWARHAFWSFPVLVDQSVGASRDEIMRHLAEEGIETRPVFYPMHVLPPYSQEGSFPVADRIAQAGICLPMHGLLTKEDVTRIASALEMVCAGRTVLGESRVR
jgi:perosamine synthetase